MDHTERKITKIAREASKLAVLAMKEDGIGTAEYDFIHAVHPPRHHPGGAAGAAEHRQGSGGPAGGPPGGQGLPGAPGQSPGRPQPAALRHGAGPGTAEL